MISYADLSAELRQSIVQLALPRPDEWRHPWIAHVHNLMLVDKQMFEDVKEVLRTWSPVYHVTKPSSRRHLSVQTQNQLCILPQPRTVCLSLFHLAKAEVLQECSAVFRNSMALVPLLTDWENQLPRILLNGIQTVLVDATPAPGWLRQKGPTAAHYLVCDRVVRNYRLPDHQIHIVDLLKSIAGQTHPRVRIVMVGLYSERSRVWVDEVVSACATVSINLEVDADFVHKPPLSPKNDILDREAARIANELETCGSCRIGPDACHACRTIRVIRYRRWRRSTQDIYASCLLNDASWPSYALTESISFVLNSTVTTVDLRPGNAVQRKLAHRIVEDLGYWTETVGQEPRRFVRLSKSRLQRPWEQPLESSTGETVRSRR